MNEQDGMDRLFEELTLERNVIIPSQGGPYGGFLNGSRRGTYYGCQRTNTATIEYRNSEGKLHRIFGPAAVNKDYKIEEWYKNGELHRIGGPAVTHKYDMFWYKEGKLHRLDGPAIITDRGPKQFYIEGVKLPPKEYKREIQRMHRRGLIK